MTIKKHVEAMQILILNLDKEWATRDAAVKSAWLSNIMKLAQELKGISDAEIKAFADEKMTKRG
jgi:hypothetical protein